MKANLNNAIGAVAGVVLIVAAPVASDLGWL
jgi:hypothetical protein